MTYSSSREALLDDIQTALRGVDGLLIYRQVMADRIGQAYLRLLEALCSDNPGSMVPGRYGEFFYLLAAETELAHKPLSGDAWQNHLIDRLLEDENPFSRKAERASLEEMGPSLLAAVRQDLRSLRRLFALDADRIATLEDETGRGWIGWGDMYTLRNGEMRQLQRQRMKVRLLNTLDWAELVADLAGFYPEQGTGIFAHYRAFRWNSLANNQPGSGMAIAASRSGLQGIGHPDPARLENIVGYTVQKEILVQNTDHFVAGFPANHVLLYGNRGTGKSSMVKALLNRYYLQGLRIVEVAKQDLADFARIIELLRGRRERFILFVDDLSFEEHETYYKDLKALLEGSLEARPGNVLLYATSNRRHLVKERFSDRPEPDNDEVHAWDTVQEKLSLSDRFGITIVFESPNQEQFLNIVEGLASQRGLDISLAKLRRRALEWAALHNGRSGRTARQFIDFIEAEQALLEQAEPGTPEV
ncbi:MAG: ATP-binding protein [Chloroflexi bacterium]|nr:ATP-binding protein [Chloroflexota bacterium]